MCVSCHCAYQRKEIQCLPRSVSSHNLRYLCLFNFLYLSWVPKLPMQPMERSGHFQSPHPKTCNLNRYLKQVRHFVLSLCCLEAVCFHPFSRRKQSTPFLLMQLWTKSWTSSCSILDAERQSLMAFQLQNKFSWQLGVGCIQDSSACLIMYNMCKSSRPSNGGGCRGLKSLGLVYLLEVNMPLWLEKPETLQTLLPIYIFHLVFKNNSQYCVHLRNY